MRKTLAYPVPMQYQDINGRGMFMAQLVLPDDLSPAEADRLCELIQSIVVPWQRTPASFCPTPAAPQTAHDQAHRRAPWPLE